MPYNDPPLVCRLSQKFEKEMPAQLTAEQKVVQHAMITMVENHFHW
jgi:hypothetical protein